MQDTSAQMALQSMSCDPREIRRHLRESEDAKGEMLLESYLRCVELCMSTSITSPFPSPVGVVDNPSLYNRIRPLYPEVTAILTQYDLPRTQSDFCMQGFWCTRRTKPNYPRGDIPVDVFSVSLNTAALGISSFGPTKDEILNLFRQHEINVEVEVGDWKLYHHPLFFFIASTHPLVKAYDREKHNIIAILTRTIGSNFNMICPFNVGPTAAEAQPTIVVLVEPWTLANWSELRLQILSRLRPHMQPDNFDIEFLPGDLSIFDGGGISFMEEVTQRETPRVGSSVGIQGDRTTGTLGGFVTLTHGDVAHRGFLTNHRVVRPSDNSHFLESLDHFGSSPARSLAQTITIESPARIDTDATANEISNRLNTLEIKKTELSTRLHRESAGQTPSFWDLDEVLRYQRAIEDLSLQRRAVEKMPYTLGEVKFVSGKERGGGVMDWAFVELSEAAEKKYFGPNYMLSVPGDCLPDKWSKSLPPIVQSGDKPLDRFGALEEGEYCVKKGRTTGLTAGVRNGPKAYCNWKRSSPSDSSGKVDMQTLPTEEFIILGTRAEGEKGSRPAFCKNGDSGAFVLGQWGEVKGLLWGGTRYQEYNIGLASSMPDVLASIKEKIGGSVTLSLPT